MRDGARGELITETLGYDGGRQVSVYVPAGSPEAIVFAGDGQVLAPWGADIDRPATMVVGVHRSPDKERRLHEYSPGFAPDLFAAHEDFFVHQVRRWVKNRFGISPSAERTAVWGASASGELALALGLRHPEIFGAVFSASPGAGFRPPAALPSRLPRVYLVAGRQEPFFFDNASRWAVALAEHRADVVFEQRDGSHGDDFWRHELPAMATWAFGG